MRLVVVNWIRWRRRLLCGCRLRLWRVRRSLVLLIILVSFGMTVSRRLVLVIRLNRVIYGVCLSAIVLLISAAVLILVVVLIRVVLLMLTW